MNFPRLLPVLVAGAIAALAQPVERVDKTTVDALMKELSNWGRWGKDDQMGTVNLITPAKRKIAAALVKEGYSVSLSSDADTVKSVVWVLTEYQTLSFPVSCSYPKSKARMGALLL